jgi:protein-arginine kinase activator protein McsA
MAFLCKTCFDNHSGYISRTELELSKNSRVDQALVKMFTTSRKTKVEGINDSEQKCQSSHCNYGKNFAEYKITVTI